MHNVAFTDVPTQFGISLLRPRDSLFFCSSSLGRYSGYSRCPLQLSQRRGKVDGGGTACRRTVAGRNVVFSLRVAFPWWFPVDVSISVTFP